MPAFLKVARPVARCLSSGVLIVLLQACAPQHSLLEGVPGYEQAREIPEPATPLSTGSPAAKTAVGKKFMAVTANPHATRAAQSVLADGGSAIDAAIAAQMVLGLVEPQSSGIGGGGFLLYWDAEQRELFAYDGRETAPLAADEQLFVDPAAGGRMGFGAALVGGRSVGVPGMMRMLEMAHTEHGSKPWAGLFSPAIKLATEGFAVSARLASMVARVPALKARSAMRDYLHPDGSGLREGDTLRNPAYAKTLAALASQGADALYAGTLAEDLVAVVNQDPNPGALTVYDMLMYRAVAREPQCQEVFAHRVCSMGPPSSGATTVIGILAMLEALYAGNEAPPVGTNAISAHRFIEASRLAFADRNHFLADTDFVEVPVAGLLDKQYLAARARLVDAGRRLPEAVAGTPSAAPLRVYAEPLELASTTHLSIVDARGNALSMTTSIESAFGSRLMSNGFILNNQLTDFSFLPRDRANKLVANRVQGGKRPLSSMSPVIVFDTSGEPLLLLGSPGGKSIIGFVARVLYDTLASGMALPDAIAAPHIIDTGSSLRIEPAAGEALLEALRRLGHQPEVAVQPSGLGAVQRSANGWLGVADPRREGSAAGG